MLKIKVDSLKPGVRLGKDIFTFDAQLLLPKGTIITEDHLNGFRNRNITEVFVMEASPRQKSERSFQDVFSSALDVVKSFMLEARLGKPLDFDEIDKTVELLLEQVFDVNDLFRQMRLMKSKDDYFYTHSINVSLLSILMGRWLKLNEEDIKLLGLAGLLHDVGKVFIDDSILNKPDKLTEEEFEEVKKHPSLGYGLINNYVDERVAKAILLHHERIDGSGYPMGLMGNSSIFASIVAVADVFDALTSNRKYSTKNSPYTAVEVLWEESFGKLDPNITKIFCDKITNFYVGNEVILSNGVRGIVIYIDPSQPTRPTIMAGDDFINLAEQRSLYIVDV
ncbi:MAG: HD-GYP domain-containing protein, partial [Syntrophomonadaceae bacterium]|nr:HD-GYP domain-containing protein [Syntrophomonadaceae bacterium]